MTAFVDIGRGGWSKYTRSNENYLAYSVRLLHFNVPLILFMESKFIDFVKFHRKGKENITKIVPITIETLEYYKYYKNISAVLKATQELIKLKREDEFITVPEVSSPEYIIVMASKIGLVKQAIEMNPFNSAYFYWIDFGFGRNSDLFPQTSCWAPRNVMTNPASKDKVIILEMSPIYFPYESFNIKAMFYYLIRPKVRTIDDFIKHRGIVFVMGTFFGGAVKAMLEFHALYKQVFERSLAVGFTDDDQTMIALCYLENNDLFYSVLSLDRWFSMLHLLH